MSFLTNLPNLIVTCSIRYCTMPVMQTSIFCPVSLDVEDIVGTALFLLSDQSAMINCETLLVDGGYCAC